MSRTEGRRCRPRRSLAAAVALLACVGLVALVSRPGAADARVRRPILLRIEGFLDAAPAGTRPLRTVEVRVGKKAMRPLAVTKIVNQGAGPLGQTILDEAARYKPAFNLVGDAGLVEKVASSPQGASVTLTGNFTSGRNLLLSIAEVAPPEGSPTPAR